MGKAGRSEMPDRARGRTGEFVSVIGLDGWHIGFTRKALQDGYRAKVWG